MIKETRRCLLAFMGLFSIFSPRISVAEGWPVAPCLFSFDASRNGVFVREKFTVDKERYYIFALNFYHNGGEGAKNLAELVDANEALFTAESIRLGQPVRITSNDFMEKKYFSSIHEKNETLTIANNKYWDAVHKAIDSRFTNQKSEFVFLPRNTKGVIPIAIELKKIEGEKITTVIKREAIDTNGSYLGGSGRLAREITGAILTPGLYEINAETIRDSPLFFDVPIKIAITYRSKV